MICEICGRDFQSSDFSEYICSKCREKLITEVHYNKGETGISFNSDGYPIRIDEENWLWLLNVKFVGRFLNLIVFMVRSIFALIVEAIIFCEKARKN